MIINIAIFTEIVVWEVRGQDGNTGLEMVGQPLGRAWRVTRMKVN